MSICSVKGCEKKVKAYGYCQGHYLQIKAHGKIVRPELGVFEKKACSVDGCNEPVKAKGLCARHSQQFYTHGKVISSEKLHDKNRICIIPGCGRKHRTGGYCTGHHGQIRKHGKIISSILANRSGITTNGDYVYLKCPDHPTANKRGYVKRANLVWEEITGQVVTHPAVIHHKNGIKTDDSFENLEYFITDAAHQAAHHVAEGHRGFIAGGLA